MELYGEDGSSHVSKILYAEDDEYLAALMVNWLQFETHEVDQVESGAEALELLRFNQYDLAIFDYMLKDMSGMQVCEELRRANSDLPILMLTGTSGKEVEKSCTKAGADLVLHKPPDFDSLSRHIAHFVKNGRSR